LGWTEQEFFDYKRLKSNKKSLKTLLEAIKKLKQLKDPGTVWRIKNKSS
jgi:uncharacterized membrane protein (DUF106 family)